ncbi:hypothetical protein I6F35_28665 [Bradyrhizobium sp. BRP22]|uniref:hypothetical protein n=1 Tax=Bradyrhizobium sp. BRP22 TaxID=2793821 RepID=UPI001CD757E5|nr:hypothetical protein [Bradyrhizobium sp. BRP22]MCA1457134.1 hypothetical protein [Bradyrhizobium sp. BRP22]
MTMFPSMRDVGAKRPVAGIIFMQMHVNQPGEEEKAAFASQTSAAEITTEDLLIHSN